jgi:hypothetical protein
VVDGANVEDGALRRYRRAGCMTKLIVDGKEIEVPPEYTPSAGVRGRGRGNSDLLLP